MIAYKNLTEIIGVFMQMREVQYPNDIDPLSKKLRSERVGITDGDDSLLNLLDLRRYGGIVYHIADLLKTPRLLKMALRRTKHSWDILHGEIDFDDLFVVNVLRFAAPEAFDFLLENIYEIRALESRGLMENNEKKERKDFIQNKWKTTTQSVPWAVKAAEELINFLFPNWGPKIYISNIVPPQGVRHSSPTDYWLRAIIEDLTNDKVRDQEAFSSAKLWKHDHDSKAFRGLRLPEALFSSSDLCEKIEQFEQLLFEANELLDISSIVFKLMVDKDGPAANSDTSPAFTTLWRLSTRKPVDESHHETWFKNEIQKYIAISLRFANDLYYYWRYSDRTAVEMKRFNPELYDFFVAEAKKSFADFPQRLVEALDKNYPYNIYHFAVFYSSPEQKGKGFNPSNWKWLADALLEAAKIQPQIVVPQIITWIFETSSDPFRRDYKFRNDWLAELFGVNLEMVMKLIEMNLDYSHLSNDSQSLISFAQETAKKWLQKEEDTN